MSKKKQYHKIIRVLKKESHIKFATHQQHIDQHIEHGYEYQNTRREQRFHKSSAQILKICKMGLCF